MRHVSVLGPVAAGLLFSSLAHAAEPASQTIAVPAKAGTYTYHWSGTALPGAAAQAVGVVSVASDPGTGSCGLDATDVTNDVEAFTFAVPDGIYGAFSVKAHFKIVWEQTGTLPANPAFKEDALPDLAMTLLNGADLVGNSDNSIPEEEIVAANPVSGDYSLLVCPAISNAPTDYSGTLTVEVAPVAEVTGPASADAQGLEFSATLVDELQYFEGEPLVTTDFDGTIYTCGPAGSGWPMADYAQASLDGGDQFNRLGDPTTGRMGLEGGGDCAMATGLERNSDGNYQLAYSGLSNLAQFTVSTSPDKGKTLTNVPFSSTAPVADRQWLAFTDAMNVFHMYKNEQTFAVVHQSTNGGLAYGPPVIVVANPAHVGPLHSMTKDENPARNGKAALYFPWASDQTLALAISLDAGATWNNCAITQAKGTPDNLFPVIDHDTAGNLYAAFADSADNNTYLVTVKAAELLNCKGGSGQGVDGTTITPIAASPKVRMNLEKALTTVMPWVAAGGAPGRVAVSFYASPVIGEASDKSLPHVWNVYVSQSLNALDANPKVAQVKATTHPMHYDQICVSGTLCATGGDRALSDFFSIAYNKKNGELDLVFNRSGKKPGDGDKSSGPITATAFARQISGPSNGGGVVARNGRQVVRNSSADPTGDAYGGFSNLVVAQDRYQLAALDLTNLSIEPARDLKTREALNGGGITVTMKLKDLSDGALNDALTQSGGQSLVWMFYYWDGYTPHAIAATWDGSSFTFGYSGATEQTSCVAEEAVAVVGCSQYKLDTVIDGSVDQATGRIEMTVPLSMLKALTDVPAPARSPAEVAGRPGDRIHSAAAYTFVNLTGTSADPSQSLMPVDNTAAMDFVIPPGALAASSESACVLPGITVVQDAPGDSTDLQSAHDILSVHVAEPADMPGKFAMTMNVGDLSTLPPNTQWIVLLTTPDQKPRFVAMTSEGGTPAFKAGDVAIVDGGATSVTTYTYTDDLDPASTYNPDGTITLIVPAALIGSPKPGESLTSLLGRTRIVTSESALSAGRAMDDTDTASYPVVGGHCGGGGKAGESHGLLLGGSLGLFTLLPLFGAGFLRRRKHH